MSNGEKQELILIGGSAGSLPVLMQVITLLSDDFVVPVVIIIHRQRNALSEFTKILTQTFKNKRIVEPDDKESIEKSCIYVAPQNYHLLMENDRTFSLDYSEAIKFSRPSIDVTFESAARIYRNKLCAILLSGANSDGTAGLKAIVDHEGTGIVQEPSTAEFPAMPRSAITSVAGVQIMEPVEIGNYINSLNSVKFN